LRKENDLKHYISTLNLIYEVQGADNFKKITGFSYTDFNFNIENIKTEEDILKLVQLNIIKTGKQEVAKKSGLTVPTINKIFESKNMTYKTFFSLTNALNLEVSVRCNLMS
jgi:DNA-binding phage protein